MFYTREGLFAKSPSLELSPQKLSIYFLNDRDLLRSFLFVTKSGEKVNRPQVTIKANEKKKTAFLAVFQNTKYFYN